MPKTTEKQVSQVLPIADPKGRVVKFEMDPNEVDPPLRNAYISKKTLDALGIDYNGEVEIIIRKPKGA